MKNWKKSICAVLSLLLILSLLPAVVSANPGNSGTCGLNNSTKVKWNLDSSGTLTISGSGAMENYTHSLTSPWYPSVSMVKKIVIQSGVTAIGDYCFEFCYNATSVEIPKSVKTIGDRAFAVCTNLKTMPIPENITSIGEQAFMDCGSLTGFAVDPKNAYFSNDSSFLYNKNKTVLISSISNLQGSYSIPASVTTIGPYAFLSSYYNLSVTIPAGVTTIGEGAFAGCSALTGIWVDEANSKFSSDSRGVLFNKEKTALLQAPGKLSGDYEVPSGVRTIEVNAFRNNGKLVSLMIPDSVTDVKDEAFFGCGKLKKVTMGSGLKTIGEKAFYSCEALAELTLGENLTTIGADAFTDCNALETVTIPDSVTTLGQHAFWQCRGLTTLILGDGLTEVSKGAFEDCTALKEITFGSKLTSIGENAFRNCPALEELVVPDTVTKIGDFSFHGGNLTKLDIGNGVKTIGYGAFVGQKKLTAVTFGAALTRVGTAAFESCDNLKNIYYRGTQAQWKKVQILEDNEPLLAATVRYVANVGGLEDDGEYSTSDAVYVLLYVMFGADDYPVPEGMDLDFNGSGKVDTNDAVYLLLHVMFGAEDYPI